MVSGWLLVVAGGCWWLLMAAGGYQRFAGGPRWIRLKFIQRLRVCVRDRACSWFCACDADMQALLEAVCPVNIEHTPYDICTSVQIEVCAVMILKQTISIGTLMSSLTANERPW